VPGLSASSVSKGQDLSPDAIKFALGKPDRVRRETHPLQLAGGEPTLHEDLEEILSIATSLGFIGVEIDTNGLALGRDASLAPRLREAGLSRVYLQMDGLDGEVSRFIRGRDIVADKVRAIENCRKADLQVALSVTVVRALMITGCGRW